MTIAGLTQTEMLAILKANGFEVIDDRYWELEGVERVMMGKGTNSFPLRLKKFYPYYEVMKRVTMLSLSIIPDECQEPLHHCLSAFEQHTALIRRAKERKEGGSAQSPSGNTDATNQASTGA